MRASYNLEILHCGGGVAGRQNTIIILATGSIHHLPFLLLSFDVVPWGESFQGRRNSPSRSAGP